MATIYRNQANAARRRAAVVFYDNAGAPLPGQTFSAAAGEVQISQNGAAFVNASADGVAIGAGAYYAQLSQAETNFDGDILLVKFSKASYRDEIVEVEIKDSTENEVWDALPANHVVAGSFGELGTRPTGAVVANGSNISTSFCTNLTSASDNYYTDSWCCFLSGALAGQVHKVIGYNGTTKFLTFGVAFTAAPAAADRFILVNK